MTNLSQSGLGLKQITQIEQRYELDLYLKRDLAIVSGEGSLLYDAMGKEYIDCAAGIGVANTGHSNPAVVQAVNKQAQRLITCPEIFYNDIRAKFLQQLVDVSPDNLTRVFLCNSGTEATEAAIKLARYSTGKSEIISLMRGFHGRTMGSLSATFDRKIRKPFAPLLEDFTFTPLNNIERLQQSISPNTAAIMIELIQGNGGVHIADQKFVSAIQEICSEQDILLIVDEVQTGFGRTGTLFAFEQYGIDPDIVCLAKAIAGGIPMGAILCSDRIRASKNMHGSTFGGNPLACAAALANIEFILENNLADRAKILGEYFVDKLSTHELSKVREIRYRGLLIGIELRERVYPIILELINRGIIALPAGSTVLRLLPPLVITPEQLDEVVGTLVDLLN